MKPPFPPARRLRRLRTRAVLIAVCSSLGALMVAACGSSSSSSSSSTADAGTTSAAAATGTGSGSALAGVSSADRTYLENLYKQAKASGHLDITVYDAYGGTLNSVFSAAEKAFPGLKINDVDIFGGDAFSRVDAEFSTGKHQASAVLSGISDVGYYYSKHYLAHFVPKTASGLPRDLYQPGQWYTPFQTSYGLVYNTNLVSPSDLPTSLTDLTDSKWSGKLTTGQFVGVAPNDFTVTTLLHDGLVTTADLKGLAKNITTDANGVIDAQDQVAQGRKAIALWGPESYVPALKAKGAPIATAPLKDGQILNGPGWAVLKGAPATQAAELLGAFLFTPTAQRLFADDTYNYPTMKGSPTPPGFPARTTFTAKQLPIAEFSKLLASNKASDAAIFNGGK